MRFPFGLVLFEGGITFLLINLERSHDRLDQILLSLFIFVDKTTQRLKRKDVDEHFRETAFVAIDKTLVTVCKPGRLSGYAAKSEQRDGSAQSAETAVPIIRLGVKDRLFILMGNR